MLGLGGGAFSVGEDEVETRPTAVAATMTRLWVAIEQWLPEGWSISSLDRHHTYDEHGTETGWEGWQATAEGPVNVCPSCGDAHVDYVSSDHHETTAIALQVLYARLEDRFSA